MWSKQYQLPTFYISNGSKSTKHEDLQPAQTLSQFEMKLPSNLPLLIQFTDKRNSKNHIKKDLH
jgi:hypothetical protein